MVLSTHYFINIKQILNSKVKSKRESSIKPDKDTVIDFKSKITKILDSEENSKRKVPNEMTKSKAQTHQRNR